METIPEVWQRVLFEYEGAPSRKVVLRVAKANPDVAAYLAASLESPLSLLEQLSELAPREIARNPNASLELLARVGAQAPAELLENPLLPLLALESPEKFQEMFKGLVSKLLAFEDPPPMVFRLDFLQTTKDQISALFHRKVPRETVIELAGHDNPDVRESAAKNRLLPPLYKRLASLIQNYFGQQPSFSVAELEEAARGPLWAKILIASLQETPEPILLHLSNEQNVKIQQKLAGNPSSSLEVLQRLMPFERSVAYVLAYRKQLHLELFDELLALNDFEIYNLMALNPSIPGSICGELLRRYCSSSWSPSAGRYLLDYVRPLLDRGDLPVDVLLDLARDVRAEVRGIIAKSAVLPVEGVALLAADKDPNIRAKIASRKDLPAEILARLAADPDARVRATIAPNKSLPQALLQKLAEDTDQFVRARVALNAGLSLHMMRALAGDKVEMVRVELAKNHRLHSSVRAMLEQDSSALVRQSLRSKH